MKKRIGLGLFLLTGLSLETFAATGYAYDGLAFILVIIGILLITIALMAGFDYIRKNGRKIFHNAVHRVKRKIRIRFFHPVETNPA
jgi:hypothetical protein